MTKQDAIHHLDKATDYISVAWLTAWLADFINHVPWVNMTAMVLFFWTVGRALWWLVVTYKRWSLNRFCTTRDAE